MRGGSVIVGPLGDILAGPVWDEQTILFADLDLAERDGARMDLDPTPPPRATAARQGR